MRFIPVLLLLWSTTVTGVEPGDCASALDRQLNGWDFPPINRYVFDGATRAGKNPFVTTGDFDNDKTSDVAFLIVKDSKRRIAVCLSGRRGVAVFIPDPYCGDGISLVRRGAEYHDFETDSEGRYDRDGVHAYCFEKAGATYIYKDGAFQAVVDSD